MVSPLPLIDQAPAHRRSVLPVDPLLRQRRGRCLWRQPPTTPLYTPKATSSTSRLGTSASTSRLAEVERVLPRLGGGPRQTSILMMQWAPASGWDQSSTTGSKDRGWLAGTHGMPFTLSRGGIIPSTSKIDWTDRHEFMFGRPSFFDREPEDEHF